MYIIYIHVNVDICIYVYTYIYLCILYICIYKRTLPTGFYIQRRRISCRKANLVMTGRPDCFHDHICVMSILVLQDCSTFCYVLYIYVNSPALRERYPHFRHLTRNENTVRFHLHSF